MNETFINALVGGILIGLMAIFLSGGLGRVMGISGIIKGVLPKAEKDSFWRYLFLVGIVIGGVIYVLINPDYYITNSNTSLTINIISGILVGIGISMSNGCTSGHAVCGIGRLSMRSIIATITFLSSGIVTIFISNFF